MIQYIKRQEIDTQKYDLCITSSKNSRIYAFSWYLDIVADNWDVLILNDYEVVMPLPWRSKYFIKYIYPPCWTQQLGVFSSDEISKELVSKFVNNIPKKFKKVTINFNSGNQPFDNTISERINYILSLDKPHNELFEGYKQVRKRSVKKVKGIVIEYNQSEIRGVIELHKGQKRFGLNDAKKPNYHALEELINCLLIRNQIDIVIAKNEKGEILGGAFFLKGIKRITYLVSAISDEGRSKQVMTLIINSIIEKYAKTNWTLDFEGSMIPGIAFFFKSFGSKKEMYGCISKANLR